ncbi:hypothetical protein H072_11448 [Dactylellina haptotyla CBS 200.50]|uniref:Uncharacterized protein n=1 Tax=Dactylellina haptotyla (strain CBS 200.50) TaxID=1284197 RepID=S8A244_DACHA|nr:hypothetical protein H072_11448 [Dactylellina haptotyla CBS 200.50]
MKFSVTVLAVFLLRSSVLAAPPTAMDGRIERLEKRVTFRSFTNALSHEKEAKLAQMEGKMKGPGWARQEAKPADLEKTPAMGRLSKHMTFKGDKDTPSPEQEKKLAAMEAKFVGLKKQISFKSYTYALSPEQEAKFAAMEERLVGLEKRMAFKSYIDDAEALTPEQQAKLESMENKFGGMDTKTRPDDRIPSTKEVRPVPVDVNKTHFIRPARLVKQIEGSNIKFVEMQQKFTDMEKKLAFLERKLGKGINEIIRID